MTTMRLLAGVLIGAVALSAPAAATAIGAESDYGSYVRGHLALADGELDRAAQYFAGALAYAPDDPQLLRQTFDLAIASGDEALAVKVGERLARQDRFDSGVALVIVAEALKRRDWKAASDAVARLSDAGFGSFIGPIIDAWMLEARGKRDKALRRLQVDALDGFARSYVVEHRAHMLFRDRQYAEAAAIYDELASGDAGRNVRMLIAAAAAWQAAGDMARATERLDRAGGHPDVDAARAALARGKPIAGIPRSANAGVALLALRMAADLSRERPVPVAMTLARIATFLAPEEPASWLLTSELLARAERYHSALAAVRRIAADSPAAPLARGQEAALLASTERAPEALRLLEDAARSDGATAGDWGRFGEALAAAQRYGDAAAAFDRAIALSKPGADDLWRLHFLHGSALEQAGRWDEAEPVLRRALAAQPNDASLLNYLGYSLLDRGVAMAEARRLIEKAHELAPDDGFITDSLGWAQYAAGEYDAAVKTLERAVASVPDDPVIAEHLGDAYWRVGRRLEARHRWKAALDSNPKPEQVRQLAAKYDFGLDIALADARKHATVRP